MDTAWATLLPSASPSSSNPTNELPYNIFISHCVRETTHTLAASTYNTLKSMGYKVFLEMGDSLAEVITSALRSSFLHIALLSPRYAEYRDCLEELSSMLETGCPFIPVFYNVDPSDIRLICKGKGIYAKAFSKHEAKGMYHSDILKWKRSLEKVSNLKGHIVNNEESESAFLEKLQEAMRTCSFVRDFQQNCLVIGEERPSEQVEEILTLAGSSLQNQGNDGRTSSQNDVENRSGEERPSQQVEEILPLVGSSLQNQENDGQTSSQNDVENPRSGSSRTQIKEAVKEKWKYVNCSLVLVGISLTFFSSDLQSHTHLSPILVEITLLTVCVILGVLFFMIYDKIMKEHRVRRGNNEAAVFPCKPHQLIILALSSCVASAVYIYFAINEMKKKKNAP